MDKFIKRSNERFLVKNENLTKKNENTKLLNSTSLSLIKNNEIDEPENTVVSHYIKSLSPKEYKAYLIAKTHLGSSFNIFKSNGFLQWIEKHEK